MVQGRTLRCLDTRVYYGESCMLPFGLDTAGFQSPCDLKRRSSLHLQHGLRCNAHTVGVMPSSHSYRNCNRSVTMFIRFDRSQSAVLLGQGLQYPIAHIEVKIKDNAKNTYYNTIKVRPGEQFLQLYPQKDTTNYTKQGNLEHDIQLKCIQ